MADYLQPVSDGMRRMTALVCISVALVAAAATGLVIAAMIRDGRLDHDGKPVWIGAVVCGLIALAFGWMAVRLWSGRSANGVTVLPVWFIEVFGCFFLTCMVWVAVERGLDWGIVPAIGVAVAMVRIRWAVRRRVTFSD